MISRTTLSLLLLFNLQAVAQSTHKTTKEEIIGTWSLELVDNILPDGSRIQLYGAEPKGLLIFDANGNYSLQIMSSTRMRFSGNDKAKGTPEENAAAVKGTNTHFGRYTFNEEDQTITFHIDHAFFPNWEGTEQKRTFTLANDVLKYNVPVPTSGGAAVRGEVVWRKKLPRKKNFSYA